MSSFSETEESEAEIKVPAATPVKEPASVSKVITRSVTATLLSLFYLGLLQTGHLYCIISIVLIQVILKWFRCTVCFYFLLLFASQSNRLKSFGK